MSVTNRVRLLYLCHLSKPVQNRPVYQAIRRQGTRRIVEIGLSDGQRARRLIEVAAFATPLDQIEYTGIDLFEANPNRPHLTLKDAHRLLKATGARVRLLPGDPHSVLARAANSLAGTDLLLISADQDPESLERAWFYVPRMLHGRSLVCREEATGSPGEGAIRPVPLSEVVALSAPKRIRHAA